MFEQLKQNWRSLRRGQPGLRFQEQYDRQRKRQQSGTGRILRIIAALILVPIGMFLLPAPGPGIIVLALGALLIAREFRLAAQVLDALEVRGRRAVKWGQHRWQRLTVPRRKA